jgi:hypothetical protein
VERDITEGRKRDIFANPFFVIMMGASVVFVLTVLGYLVSGFVLEPNAALASIPGRRPPDPRSLKSAEWLDRNAPWALAVEFGVMLLSAVVAIITDPWFTPTSKPQPPQ